MIAAENYSIHKKASSVRQTLWLMTPQMDSLKEIFNDTRA